MRLSILWSNDRKEKMIMFTFDALVALYETILKFLRLLGWNV